VTTVVSFGTSPRDRSVCLFIHSTVYRTMNSYTFLLRQNHYHIPPLLVHGFLCLFSFLSPQIPSFSASLLPFLDLFSSQFLPSYSCASSQAKLLFSLIFSSGFHLFFKNFLPSITISKTPIVSLG